MLGLPMATDTLVSLSGDGHMGKAGQSAVKGINTPATGRMGKGRARGDACLPMEISTKVSSTSPPAAVHHSWSVSWRANLVCLID